MLQIECLMFGMFGGLRRTVKILVRDLIFLLKGVSKPINSYFLIFNFEF